MNFQEESSNQTFVASTAVVAFGGLIVLVLLVIYFRPKPKPEITERIVEVSAVPFDPPAPPPPPPPAPKAEPKPPPPALPSPPPPKTKVEVRTGGVWDGIWRLPTLELPMFEFRQNGETISGTYSPPTWSDIYSFTHGIIRGDTAQLAVRDELHRVFFRFRRYKKDGIAIVEQWITPEDALEFYRNAQNLVRNPPKKKRRLTPQEIIALRIAVQAALASAGKVQRVGVFYRVVNQGERKLPENLRTK